jgi:hypothetical protein
VTANPLPPSEELWEMVNVFSRHADELKDLLSAEREKNNTLDTENSGWLAVYQGLQSRIVELEAEISRLRSWTEVRQGKS